MMKFFLPHLYVQLNSPDEALGDLAEEELELASERYSRHWDSIKPQLPANVVRFYEEQMLHDADVLTPARFTGATALWNQGDVILVAQQINTLNADYLNTLILLRYVVTEEPRVEVPVQSDVFDRSQPTWEYDEFDLAGTGVFTHSIFLSDGRVVTIHFREFHYYLANLIAPDVLKALGAVPPDKAASA